MTINLSRTPDSVRSETFEGHVRKNGIFVGFVKDNRDAQRMGRLQVYIPEFGGDPKDPASWYIVSYASPFAGATNVENTKKGDTTMKGSQQSYGFWMVPPDLENEVLCCFANGDTARGFWFACLYQQFMNHMVPGTPVNKSTRPDIDKLNTPPVVEYNKQGADNVWDPKRPVFEPLHNGLIAQGLYADPERGPQTSGARREAPSKVFGFSTPRANAVYIDDDPNNEFIRLRTRSGVQIVIHETTGYIYMVSKQGNSWMEISDIGIDLYSKRSISMRAEENVNIHADKSIILHGAGAIHSSSANITQCSSGRITSRAAGEVKRNSPRIKDNSKASDDKNNQKKGAPGTGEDAAKPKEGEKPKDGETPKPGETPKDGDKTYGNLDGAKDSMATGSGGPSNQWDTTERGWQQGDLASPTGTIGPGNGGGYFGPSGGLEGPAAPNPISSEPGTGFGSIAGVRAAGASPYGSLGTTGMAPATGSGSEASSLMFNPASQITKK